MGNNDFDFDRRRFRKVLDLIVKGVKERRGIFSEGKEIYLPQWRMPEEFEYSPRRKKVKKPFEASLWLWTRMFCDRRSQSEHLMKKVKYAWENKSTRWIFYPEEVVKRTPTEIQGFIKTEFDYALSRDVEKSVGDSYRDNSQKLLDEYCGDPRRLITRKTIEQARENIMSFDKFGTGLANLLICEMLDRQIVSPSDPENALFKIDVHNERLPLMTNALSPKKDYITTGSAVSFLEEEYRSYCHDRELSLTEMGELDSALWILGSRVCAQKDYGTCVVQCPITSLCVAFPEKNDQLGRFVVREGGKGVDQRRRQGQLDMFSS